MKPLETSIRDVLRDAIQSEVDSRAEYLLLAEHAATPEVREKLIELADKEILHRVKLERRYKEMVGEDPPPPRTPAPELPSDPAPLDMKRALRIALEHERVSESNYRFLAERVPNTDLGRLFLELAETEWMHKSEIQNEFNAMVDPDEFLNGI